MSDRTIYLSASRLMIGMLQQKINKKYLDKKLLDDFLIANFGRDGFEVEAKSEVYILTVPRELTEASRDREFSNKGVKQGITTLTFIKMEPIEDRILDLQIKNFESVYFIPAERLEQALTESVIRDVVTKCGVDVQKRAETISIIQSGAKKIFAILILMRREILIRYFIEHDQFQTEKLDAKLPLSESWLQSLIGERPAKLFCQKQWIFIAPYFRYDLSHRALADDAILPFTSSCCIGSGGFGTVYEVTLDPIHQGVRGVGSILLEIKLVRKQIELSESAHPAQQLNEHIASYSDEGDILSILRLVNHPSIVRLITTFSHRGSYNLLFFPAEGDLYQLLSCESRPPGLQTDDAFLIALQGLSSALATLHEFSSHDFDLKLIGCHHDLKPSNILVDIDRFLLADFGLSRIKASSSDSKTTFKGADSNYIAPESEFGENMFERALVGRKSDIWAFGCILIEVLTYMVMGPGAVKSFEDGRRARVMNWVLYQFHNGGQPHPFVHSWIEDLEFRAPARLTGLFTLIRTMLEIDPSRRPDASSVSSKLSFISASSQYYSAVDRLGTLSDSTNSFSVLAEFERLNLWASAIGLFTPEGSWNTLTDICGETIDFRDLCQCFSTLTVTLNLLENSKQHDQSFNPAIRQLRRHIDRLCSFLPQERKDKLKSALEIRLLSVNDQDALWRMQSEFEDMSILPNVRLLAIAKFMSLVSDTIGTSSHVKKFTPEEIDVGDDFGAKSNLALIGERASEKKAKALIEWLEYDLQWAGEVGQELFGRIEKLAELLHQSPKPSGFHSLDCVGYYHEVQRHSFGLVFELPLLSGARGVDSVAPKTLIQLIQDFRSVEKRPLLGNVFRLAHALSSSVLQFHKAGWLHKNISAFNVSFFPGEFESAAAAITQPYLIGFNHSRPDEPNAFTLGPDHNPEQKDYSHPEYLKDESRFECVHDYYSLGIVLLEIGLWRSLSSLAASMNDEDQSPENLRRFLIRKYVPRLGNAMGEIYQKAVLRCLTSNIDDIQRQPNSTGDTPSILSGFEDNVVVPISRCYA